MNSSEVDKIKALVAISPILSQSERTEWLALLELMDDKQLGELEKILLGDKGIGNRGEAIARQHTEPAVTQQSSQMPKLSHIMNLPNLNQGIGNRGQIPNSKSQIPKAEAHIQTLEQKKPSVFATKLDATVKEKELSAGHRELDLPDGKEFRSQELGIRNQKQESAPIQTQKIQESTPKAFFPVAEKSTAKLPSSPQPPVPKAKSLPEVKPQAPEPVQPKEFAINVLQDLSLLKPETLNMSPLDSIIKKIRQLISKYGYFAAIFNIEKSPLYKGYINTGLKILSDQSSFESLSGQKSGDYLTKEQFEDFTDLLSKIQAE